MITDRLRFTVIETNTDRILTHDLVVIQPQVMKTLSGPAHIQFKIPQGEATASAAGINWKNWGQWIIVEIEVDGVQEIFATGIVTSNKIDKASGELSIEATGYSNYPKGIPWLENFNPIAVDPFEVVQRVWAHVQSYENANLGVEVVPASSGTEMLPGYSFTTAALSMDFWAVFIRAVDFNDCGDTISALARDIPFDYVETAVWNTARNIVSKTIQLAYPYGGSQQDHLAFRLGENISECEMAEELDIEPVSDIIIRGWSPGSVYSSMLSDVDENGTPRDMTRLRRTIIEEDANIESTERAAAWAKKKLIRRNIPLSFSKIIIDPNHPNAPYGSFDVGDNIYVQAFGYPWHGDIVGWHRIITITYDQDSGTMELGLKVEGAFNYDPILYDPNLGQEIAVDTNKITNGYFGMNLNYWTSVRGQWIRVDGFTYSAHYSADAGCVRIDCDDRFGEKFLSDAINVTAGKHYNVQAAVRWVDLVSDADTEFQLLGLLYLDNFLLDTVKFDFYKNPTGSHGWQMLQNKDWVVPSSVNKMKLQFTITEGVDGGHAFWTYARVTPVVPVPIIVAVP